MFIMLNNRVEYYLVLIARMTRVRKEENWEDQRGLKGFSCNFEDDKL